MKVALIGDVHANLPALETVLAHARSQGAEATWNIGDFVGYGPYPDEVVERIRSEEAISIAGNYDLKVLRFPEKREKWSRSKNPLKFFAFQWAYEHLSPENRRYLRSLPEERGLEVGSFRILLTHASPASNEEPLTPETPAQRLRELAQLAASAGGPTDIIICGHSHREFARQIDGTLFINTGSVGRPDDGDPRAAYAILEIEAGSQPEPLSLTVKHFRLEYNVGATLAAMRARGLPEAFGQMLIQGRDLETVLDQ